MNWSSLAIVALATLIGAGLLIALVENWSRLAPLLSRWGWLLKGPIGLWFGYSAFQGFGQGDTYWGSVSIVLAGMFGWSAVTGFRRMRGLSAK
jgi:hypothetical protein